MTIFPTDSIKPSDQDPVETVEFKIVYNKQKYDVTFPTNETVAKLKAHVQTLTGNFLKVIYFKCMKGCHLFEFIACFQYLLFTGVPSAMQKIMFKGKKNKVNHHKQIFININFLKWLK